MQFIGNAGLGKLEVRDRSNCAAAVQDASFSVAEGEIFCIVRLSGSGKLTLIRRVNRLIEPPADLAAHERKRKRSMLNGDLRRVGWLLCGATGAAQVTTPPASH